MASQADLFDQIKEKSLPKLVERYLEYLRIEQDASPYTLVNYEIDLRDWFSFIFENFSGLVTLKNLSNLKTLRAYLAQANEEYSKATISRRLSVIKGFLKFLHREGELKKNVAALIQLPRAEVKLPRILKPEEILQMIQELPAVDLRHKRNLAIIELFYSTGIRVAELVSLNIEDVDFRQGIIKVKGKGRKERLVPLGSHCQKALNDYIASMPATQKRGPTTPFFLNRDGERLSVRTVQRDVRKLALQALGGAGVGVSPHTFRHSCATHLLSGGAGLREIQEFLGHRSLVTTQKYTQVDIKRLKQSYQAAHPRSSLKKNPKESSRG